MTRIARARRTVVAVRVGSLVAGVGAGTTPVAAAAPTTVVESAPQVASLTAGGWHTCALLTDGRVKCWGSNASGQLGLGDEEVRGDEPSDLGDALPAVDLGAGRTATAVTAGGDHTCALLDDGRVKCWGENSSGQLGLGLTGRRGDDAGEMGDALPAVDLGTGRTATAIAAGEAHSCALLDDGTVKCWGQNFDGELGLGAVGDRGDEPGEMGDALPAVDLGTGRTATAIDAGDDRTCAVLDDGELKCWGWAFLGLGDLGSRGDEPGEMGDALPPVDLGTGRTARSVSIGWSHTCAVLDDATTKCWGDNREGILGLGDVAPRGSQPGQMGDALPAVDLGTGFTPSSVAAGQYFSCGVSTDGRVKCWGQNIDGVLGTADATYHGESPDSMGDGLPAVDLGAGVTATAVTAGAAHACALLADGGVKCWGRNFGTLGVGDEQARGDDARLMGDRLPRVALTGPTHGPDLSVRVRGGNLQGEGRFGADYPCGCVVAGGRPGGRVEFVVRLRNAGSVPDRFRLAGELWWSGHSYRILPRGQWPDVSGPVLAGAYLTEALDPGEWTTVRLFTTVPTAARADPYRYRNLTLAAASETAGNRDWIHTSVRLG